MTVLYVALESISFFQTYTNFEIVCIRTTEWLDDFQSVSNYNFSVYKSGSKKILQIIHTFCNKNM